MRTHIMIAALLVAPGAMLLAQDTSTTQTPQRDTIRGYNSWQNSSRYDSLQGDNGLVMKIHRINQMEIRAGRLAQKNGSSAKVKQYGQQLVRDHQAADQKLTTLAQRMGVTLKNDSSGRYGQYDRDGDRDDDRGQYGRGRDTTSTQGSARRDTTFNPNRSGDSTARSDQGYPHNDSTSMGRYGQRGDSAMQGQDRDGMQEHQQMMQSMQRLNTLTGTQFDAEFANLMAQGHDKAIKMLEQAQSTVQNAQLRTFITSTLPKLRAHLQVAQSLGGSTTVTATTSSQ